MPNIAKHESVIQGLKDGSHHVLGISINGQQVSPGTKIAKKDTETLPTLSAPADLQLPAEATYTVISIDIDAPFASWNALSPISHWVQSGFKVVGIDQSESAPESSGSGGGTLGLKSDDAPVVSWLPAGPPPGAAPHRYLFLLYSQKPGSRIPRDLLGKEVGLMQRVRFDVDGMVEKLGLGELVAVNYFVAN
ncbi:YbhB/YbcL family Raf kinase inhibitor-like protein [Aspergillus puulaauensis]|uniref:Phosphatidylethanolamine-binding protein n=1 Tax=Aspergillus puulaauensis TaxID=1220207 RepID=A0A7R7XBN8_9EURO|nr:uncharacterized protein APUU_11300A [Aspergillus puulaauensis]BCS18472.1 hypothetical protein APUU_11300A [Aspergillus puulaauensis]